MCIYACMDPCGHNYFYAPVDLRLFYSPNMLHAKYVSKSVLCGDAISALIIPRKIKEQVLVVNQSVGCVNGDGWTVIMRCRPGGR